jgi:hypothetical protein
MYEAQFRKHQVSYIKRKAAQLGLQIVEAAACGLKTGTGGESQPSRLRRESSAFRRGECQVSIRCIF